VLRSFLYITILTIIIFIPLSAIKKSEKKSYKSPSKSMSIKIVEPTPVVKKRKTPKLVKPKPKPKVKPKIKKVVKKKEKLPPKPVKKVKPKVVKEKKPAIKEEIVKEEVVVIKKVVQEKPKISTSTSKTNEYYALIYAEISKHKHYPKKSKKFKQEDTISVSFSIDKDGRVSSFKILKRSQYRALNKAVKKMFKKMKRFPKAPSEVDTPLQMSIDINFKLQKR